MEISRRSRGGRTARRTSSRRLCRRRRSTLRRPSASALLLALTVAWRASSSSRHPRLYQSCGPRCGPSRSSWTPFPPSPPLPIACPPPRSFPESSRSENKTIIIYQAYEGRGLRSRGPRVGSAAGSKQSNFPYRSGGVRRPAPRHVSKIFVFDADASTFRCPCESRTVALSL